MKKVELTEKQIDFILNENFDDNFWIYQLGRHLTKENDLFKDNEFIIDFYNIGFEQWLKFKNVLSDILCDRDNKIPKNWVEELISGDIRNLVIAIASILLSTYSIELSIAIPIIALIIKHDIKLFCKEN
jgi:hypothetical protein